MAQGIADDLASTCLLASNKPIMIAPAMNVEMWNNISTQENLNLLQKRGIDSLDPTIGEMACGEIGVGRMVEPQVIFESIQEFFATTQNLNGKKILVTAGATIEPIDPVRYISNFSSGKQGYAIAKSLAMRGADITIISGKTNLQPPSNVKIINVTTADEMYMAAAKELHQQYDAAICTAAVADYKPVVVAPQKLKKRDSNETLTITLTQNPDILKFIATSDKRPKLVIGFAAETENLLNNARAKLTSKSCDWIIANHVGETHNPVFGSDQNTVTILSNDAPDQYLGTHSKLQIANMISDQIGKWFNNANIETKENKNVRTIRS
jgi:phosphopantothenoylcysteine decarboxylase/phosphopantothenate--cysteine ligase